METIRLFLIVLLASNSYWTIHAFSPSFRRTVDVPDRTIEAVEPSSTESDKMESDSLSEKMTRRDLLVTAVTSSILLGLAAPQAANAAVWGGSSAERPVAVVGGGGRTGMEVVRALAKEGLYTVSMTRTGVDPFRVIKLPAELKSYITHYPETVDVKCLDSIQQALESTKASAVIFCASASKQGGSAFEVDDQGVGNTAALAKKLGLRLVVISALAVDRPQSKSYQITNTLGGSFNGIMDAKFNGEQQVRAASKDYVILRPGPLMSGKTTGGAAGIEINQGDTVGGGLSRDELAAAAVGALQSGVKGATVEIYRKSTATKLQPEFSVPSGRERYADSYASLFANVDVD